jgi:hypothetical protein
MKIVKLDPDELAVCNLIGTNRSLIARASRVKDAKVGKQDGAKADIMGVMAEYAFAKEFNVFPDLGLVPRSGSADGEYKGFSYDIKSTHYKTGKLLCTQKDNPDVDIYILAIVSEPTVNLVGWAFKSELVKEQNLTNLGHGFGYALTQSELRKFK